MTDAFLDPIVKTWDAHTTDEVRIALQGHTCTECGSQYNTPLAAAECCNPAWERGRE